MKIPSRLLLKTNHICAGLIVYSLLSTYAGVQSIDASRHLVPAKLRMEQTDGLRGEDGKIWKGVNTELRTERYAGWGQKLILGQLFLVQAGLSGFAAVCGFRRKMAFALQIDNFFLQQEQYSPLPLPKIVEVPETIIQEPASSPAPDFEVPLNLSPKKEEKKTPIAPPPRRVTPVVEEETEDLFDLMVDCNQHIIFTSRTQSGKTSSILGFLKRLEEKTKGENEIYIADPKGTLWGGLENIKDDQDEPRVVRIERSNPSDAVKIYNLLEYAVDVATHREKERMRCYSSGSEYSPSPWISIVDEWVIDVALAAEYDLSNKGKKIDEDDFIPRLKESLISKAEATILGGAEDNVRLFLLAQDHHMKALGFKSTGIRGNMAVVAQGRHGNFQSIEMAIVDRYLIPNQKDRNRIEKEFQEMRKWCADNPTTPIAYTSLGGHRICRIPYMPDIKRESIFKKEIV